MEKDTGNLSRPAATEPERCDGAKRLYALARREQRVGRRWKQ